MLEVTVLTGPPACGYRPLHIPSYGQVKDHSHHLGTFLIKKLLFSLCSLLCSQQAILPLGWLNLCPALAGLSPRNMIDHFPSPRLQPGTYPESYLHAQL